MSFSVDSTTLGLDSLGHPETLRKLYSNLIRSYALDALDADLPPDGESGQAHAMDFIRRLQFAPALGLGKDVR
jgi:hypothetical protein